MTLIPYVRLKMRMRAISIVALISWSTVVHGFGPSPIAVPPALTPQFSATVPAHDLSDDGASYYAKTSLHNADGLFLRRGPAKIVGDARSDFVELSSPDPVSGPALCVEKAECNTQLAIANATRLKKAEILPTLSLPYQPLIAALGPALESPMSMRSVSSSEPFADHPHSVNLIKPSLELKTDFILSLSREKISEKQRAIWRTEHPRPAVALRSEATMDALPQRASAADQQAKKLEKDSALAMQQAAAKKAALLEEKDHRFAPGWVMALGTIALACLGGIGYKRRLRKESTPSQQTAELHFSPTYITCTPVESGLIVPDMDFVQPRQAEMAKAEQDAKNLRQAASLNAEMAQCAADVAGILCDAEHWIIKQDPASAIAALEPYSRGEPLSPAPGLYLLELYRAMGNETAYTQVSARLTATFTVLVPGWTDDWIPEACTISAFPAIREAIDTLQGSPELLPLLQGLLLVDDSRFDFHVYRDIVHAIMRALEPPTAVLVPVAAAEEALATSQAERESEPVLMPPGKASKQPLIMPIVCVPLLEGDLLASAPCTAQAKFFDPDDKLAIGDQHDPLVADLCALRQAGTEHVECEKEAPTPHVDMPDVDFPVFQQPDSPRMH